MRKTLKKTVKPRIDRVVIWRKVGSLKADGWVIFGNNKKTSGNYL